MSVLPALVGSVVTVTNASATLVPVARPAGAQNGDYVVLAVRNQTANDPLTADAGLVAIGPPWDRPIVNARRRVRWFGKFITDVTTEPATYNITAPAGGRTCVAAALVRNVDPVKPVAGFGEPYGGNTYPEGIEVSTGIEISAVELAGTPALGLALFSAEFTAGNDHVPTSTPAGWSRLVDVVAYPAGGADNTVSRTFLSTWTRELTVTPTMPALMTWGAPGSAGAEVIALLGTGGPAGEVPSLAEILTYPGVDGTEDEIAPIYNAELQQQRRLLKAKYVGIDGGEWPADCKEALGNRVARRLLLRTLPLGLQPTMTEDGGTANVQVGGYDREISRLERPYRKKSIG